MSKLIPVPADDVQQPEPRASVPGGEGGDPVGELPGGAGGEPREGSLGEGLHPHQGGRLLHGQEHD